MPLAGGCRQTGTVPTYLVVHRHSADECRFAYAAWNGFDSPLRHRPALASCRSGGHRICWTVEADSCDAVRRLLPPYLASRAEVEPVSEVPIP